MSLECWQISPGGKVKIKDGHSRANLQVTGSRQERAGKLETAGEQRDRPRVWTLSSAKGASSRRVQPEAGCDPRAQAGGRLWGWRAAAATGLLRASRSLRYRSPYPRSLLRDLVSKCLQLAFKMVHPKTTCMLISEEVK